MTKKEILKGLFDEAIESAKNGCPKWVCVESDARKVRFEDGNCSYLNLAVGGYGWGENEFERFYKFVEDITDHFTSEDFEDVSEWTLEDLTEEEIEVLRSYE